MIKTGIFGGSFNPIHNGHINLAESVMEQLELDRVIMMPANVSPFKKTDDYADNADRFEMCRLATEDIEWIEVSDWELKQDSISYTYNTVQYFRQNYPEYSLYLMVGSDMLLSFDRWYRYKDILSDATLAVVSRENDDIEILEQKKSELQKYGEIILVNTQPVVISSSEIRKSIKNHQFCSCYLNEKVVQYIKQKKLYDK